ncbi:unnamed protein product [Adineta steineri]|uniref:F-box domain-containing protein n=1 Tax=Adineta steineri TaxID=433720 RepID=A0A815UKC4_9BILA|nr:unnamed protein product [Adineta steineri]
MSNCSYLFDLFPVEIMHMIFDYLSTCDILHGFFNLSSYIDSIIFNSNFSKINFRSILKCDFDLICENINPKQMISLILSDGIDTPNQSDLFLSLFQVEEFYLSLHCLVLEDINDQSMEIIINHLNQFHNLSSLTIINNNLSPLSILKSLFCRLIRLNISCEWFFHNLTLMKELKHLKLFNQCTLNQFENIIHHTPNLISLNICLERDHIEKIQIINCNLTRLVLNMSSSQMNMNYMKDFLSCFPCLIYFEIECRSDLDLCDGHEWERFLLEKFFYLKIFYFKFQLRSTVILNTIAIQNILQSYSTSYWLNEKQWFIAIEWNQRLIYSIPRFSCESADSTFRPPFHCTISDNSIFYNHINALALWEETRNRFVNVKELWLIDDPSRINLENIIDLNQIQRLIFVSSKSELSIEILINLINKMKNLNFIQFNNIPLSFYEYKQNIPIQQIHSIEILKEFKSFSLIETLNKIFPQLQRLQIKIQTYEDMEKILKIFSKSLSIVRFYCDTSNILINKKFIQNILDHSNFTFAIDNNSIRLWIGLNKVSNQIYLKEKKTTGCFSWSYLRKSILKR